MKICSRCKVEKPFDAFSRDSQKKDGYRSDCKECASAKKKEKTPLEKRKRAKDDIYRNVNGIDMRSCSECFVFKAFTEFVPNKRRPGGIGSKCRTCYNLLEREKSAVGREDRVAKRRAQTIANVAAFQRKRKMEGIELVNSFKMDPCLDCKKSYPVICMQLDHIGDDKIDNVSSMVGYNRDRILAEIAKTEAICACCHRIRSAAREHIKVSKDKRRVAFRAMIDAIKSKPCSDCGLCFSPVAMDLDHINDKNKVAAISDMAHWPQHKILIELKKVEVVCANCHCLRTEARLKAKRLLGQNTCVDCKIPIMISLVRCKQCASIWKANNREARKRINWPSINDLISIIREIGYRGTARKLNANRQSIKQHLIKAGIDPKSIQRKT